MGLTSGLGKNCGTTCFGGIDRIAIGSKSDIDNIVYDVLTGKVTAITMKSGKSFYEFIAQSDTAMFKESVKVKDKCAVSAEQEIDFDAFCYNEDYRKAAHELATSSCCGLVVIHKESTGGVWIWGLDYEDFESERCYAMLESMNRETGKVFEDTNKAQFKLKGKQKLLAASFPSWSAVPL